MKYKVIECRGYNQEHPEFFGTLWECQIWIINHCQIDRNFISLDGKRDDNGNYITYFIEEDIDA